MTKPEWEALLKQLLARLKTAKGHYVTFYEKEDSVGMGDGVFADVAENRRCCINRDRPHI